MPQVRNILKNKRKASLAICVKHAEYLDRYILRIAFNDGKKNEVDFESFLSSTKGYLKKYQNPNNFRKFKIENGNIVWGQNWDLIFPLNELYKGKIKN